MKKILAVAIAAALTAPVAFADVTFSGFVEQEFSSRDTAAGYDQGLEGDSDVGVVVNASEDLGNGMTAFAKIDLGMDDRNADTAASASVQSNDQIVGLSGGFGTVVVGAMEDFTEGKVMAMASIFESDSQNLEGGDGQNAGRFDNGMAYVSPNFSGFQVGIAGYALDTGTGLTAAQTNDNFDAVDMMASYSNGPITVRLARETTDTDTVGATQGKTNTSLGAQYNSGAFSVVAVMQKSDNVNNTAANDYTDWMLGGSYTFGNNKVVAGYEHDEQTVSGTSTDENNWQVEFQHMFSKRTKVYVGHHSADAAPTATKDGDATYFGMKHTF
ncbi:MAG: porin [Candidatus Sedimenticola sp. (ex Thyasira tokunagai)]